LNGFEIVISHGIQLILLLYALSLVLAQLFSKKFYRKIYKTLGKECGFSLAQSCRVAPVK